MPSKTLYLFSLLIALLVSSCLLFQPGFKEQWSINSNTRYDAIIVPGIPFDPPKWNRIMEARVKWAVWLYQKGITDKIIFSGSAVYTPYLESQIMALYAQELGVRAEDIILESKAQHGSENLYYSYKKAQELGLKKIALATDPYQGALMYKHNKKFDLNIPFLPVLFDTLITLNMPTPKIDYQKAEVDSFTPIDEKYGPIEKYRNSMGKRVKKMIRAEKKAMRKANKAKH